MKPVLDRYCGKCHQGDGEGRKTLDLTERSSSPVFPEPYLTLIGRPTWGAPYRAPDPVPPGFGIAGMLMVEAYGTVDPQAYVTPPPMTSLSYRSKLIELATSGKHHEVKVDEISRLRLIAWVDAMSRTWATTKSARSPTRCFKASTGSPCGRRSGRLPGSSDLVPWMKWTEPPPTACRRHESPSAGCLAVEGRRTSARPGHAACGVPAVRIAFSTSQKSSHAVRGDRSNFLQHGRISPSRPPRPPRSSRSQEAVSVAESDPLGSHRSSAGYTMLNRTARAPFCNAAPAISAGGRLGPRYTGCHP